MIRLIRICSVMLFVVSIGLFSVSGIYMMRNTDNNGPKIDMKENKITVSINAAEEELLKGITVEDKKDGDLTDSLIVEKIGMFSENNERKMTIAVCDSDNNVTKVERVISYSDYVSPRIKMTKPLRIPTTGVDTLLDIFEVEDCLEGSIKENLQITPTNNVTSYATPGEYPVKITVTNSAGDLVELGVTLEVYEYSADSMRPKVLLSDYLVYIQKGQDYDPNTYVEGVEIRNTEYNWDEDGMAGEYSRAGVSINNPVNTQQSGTYEVSYTIAEESNTAVVRQIVVVE